MAVTFIAGRSRPGLNRSSVLRLGLNFFAGLERFHCEVTADPLLRGMGPVVEHAILRATYPFLGTPYVRTTANEALKNARATEPEDSSEKCSCPPSSSEASFGAGS